MDDKLLPLNRGSARGGGCHGPHDSRAKYRRAAHVIERGLKSTDPLDNVPLDIPTASHCPPMCDCGSTDFTVIAYRCRKCGKKSV